jgi:polysaccharide export outer membrane protein
MLHIKTQIHALKLLVLLALASTFSACNSVKEFRYFSDIQNDSTTLIKIKPKEPLIQSGDILQIVVSDPDELVVRQINGTTIAAGASSGPTSPSSGYLVNDSGQITFPMIGLIKVGGLLKDQLADSIKHRLVAMKLLLDPIVIVRLTNFKVTVMGEVLKPGIITVPNERITITEAISQSGDITNFGRRDNVLVIREKNGKRIYKRLNLTKNTVFDSEFYYLENQDIVYVEPSKQKAVALSRGAQNYSMVISTVSVLLIIYTQLLK